MESRSLYDVILAFAYGEGRQMNDILASICIQQAGEEVPIVTQRDLAASIVEFSDKGRGMISLSRKDGEKIEKFSQQHPEGRFYIESAELIVMHQEKYISSLDIIKRFLKVAQATGWKRVLIVAVPQHLPRCVKDFCRESKGYDIEDIIPYEHKDVRDNEIWYNKKDPQMWVRSPLIWKIRDAILSVLPWALYKKIALQEEK